MLYLSKLGVVKYVAVEARTKDEVVPPLARCASFCQLFVLSNSLILKS